MSNAPFFNLGSKLKTLTDRLTATRAANLDEITATRLARLDATISSRASAASYTGTRAGYLDLLNTYLNANTGIMIPKFVLLTSGTTWTRPAKIVGDLVWVTAIAGGEAYNTAPSPGQGGSYISRNPYTAGATVTYTVGTGGAGTAGANGTNTVWGTITLLGGGQTNCTGARGASQNGYFYGEPTQGPYGSTGRGNGTTGGGAGLVLGGTMYGHGGSSGDAAGNGAILLEWWETA